MFRMLILIKEQPNSHRACRGFAAAISRAKAEPRPIRAKLINRNIYHPLTPRRGVGVSNEDELVEQSFSCQLCILRALFPALGSNCRKLTLFSQCTRRAAAAPKSLLSFPTNGGGTIITLLTILQLRSFGVKKKRAVAHFLRVRSR